MLKTGEPAAVKEEERKGGAVDRRNDNILMGEDVIDPARVPLSRIDGAERFVRMLEDVSVRVFSPKTEVLAAGSRKVQKRVTQMDPQGAGSPVRDFKGQKNKCHVVHRDENGIPCLDPERRGRLEMTGTEKEKGKGRR